MSPGDVIVATLSIATLAGIIYGPWQSACVDLMRQTLFEQRDRLFKLALEKRIAFDDPAYLAVRASINSLIRYAYMASFPRFLAHSAFGAVRSDRPSAASLSIDNIEDQVVHRELVDIRQTCAVAVIKLTLIKSPLLWSIGILGAPMFLLSRFLGASTSVAGAFVNVTMPQIDDDAELADQAGLFV